MDPFDDVPDPDIDVDTENPAKRYIYALKHPETGRVRYVGASNDPVKRYHDHVETARETMSNGSPKHQWIWDLLNEGLTPDMEILDVAWPQNWRETERNWIKVMRGRGEDLLNVRRGGGGGYAAKYKRRIRRMATVAVWENYENHESEQVREYAEKELRRRGELGGDEE